MSFLLLISLRRLHALRLMDDDKPTLAAQMCEFIIPTAKIYLVPHFSNYHQTNQDQISRSLIKIYQCSTVELFVI